LDYIGVSYGLTSDLYKFWNKNGYSPVDLRQTANDLTGEHSCIMLKKLSEDDHKDWLMYFWLDFRHRFISLLSYQFKELKASLALQILQPKHLKIETGKIKYLTKDELSFSMSLYDLKRLELYSQNLVDYHLIVDLLPLISTYYFLNKFNPPITLSAGQSAILLGIGCQRKSVDEIAEELALQGTHVLGLFVRAIKKIAVFLKSLEEKAFEESLRLRSDLTDNGDKMSPVGQSLQEELKEAASFIEKRQKKQLSDDLKDLAQYAVKGTEDDWDRVLKGSEKTLVTIKRYTYLLKI